MAFFFQFLLQAGLFFLIALYLGVALGLSAIGTGVRHHAVLGHAAAGGRRSPEAVPARVARRIVRIGFLADRSSCSPRWSCCCRAGDSSIVTLVPLLLAGLGIGALASQLASVAVSSVPDERSGEVGGLQNTATNLGASIATAFAGAVLVAALSSTRSSTACSRTPTCRPRCTRAPRPQLVAGRAVRQRSRARRRPGPAGVPDRRGAGDHRHQHHRPREGAPDDARPVGAHRRRRADRAPARLPDIQPADATSGNLGRDEGTRSSDRRSVLVGGDRSRLHRRGVRRAAPSTQHRRHAIGRRRRARGVEQQPRGGSRAASSSDGSGTPPRAAVDAGDDQWGSHQARRSSRRRGTRSSSRRDARSKTAAASQSN